MVAAFLTTGALPPASSSATLPLSCYRASPGGRRRSCRRAAPQSSPCAAAGVSGVGWGGGGGGNRGKQVRMYVQEVHDGCVAVRTQEGGEEDGRRVVEGARTGR